MVSEKIMRSEYQMSVGTDEDSQRANEVIEHELAADG